MKKDAELANVLRQVVRAPVAAALAHSRDGAYEVATAREPEDDQHPAMLRGKAGNRSSCSLDHGCTEGTAFSRPFVPGRPDVVRSPHTHQARTSVMTAEAMVLALKRSTVWSPPSQDGERFPARPLAAELSKPGQS